MRCLCFFLIFFLQFVAVFSQDENSTYFKIEGDSVFKKEIDLKVINKKKDEIGFVLEKLNNYLCLHIENQISKL